MYSSKDLRNNNRPLLRRIQRQVEKSAKKEAIEFENTLFNGDLFIQENSLKINLKKESLVGISKALTRLGFYENRRGKR